jgi:hypothetical protein
MKRKLYSLIVAFTMLFATSCDLDLLENPNAVTAETASPTFILNSVQINFAGSFNTLSTFGMRMTRIISQPNVNYANAYFALTLNGTWSTTYASILNDIKFLEELNAENPIPRHLGIARVIKAITLMNIVDFVGDVPLTEALDPTNFNPVVDPGEQVYRAAFDALQLAKTDFATATANLPNDFYYGNDVAKWLKLINTLELKYYLNRKLIDAAGSTAAINALVADNNLLAAGDDFVFRYGTNLTNPDSRHPRFASQYGSGGGDYQGTWFMFHLTEAKASPDPRARYYFYRQTTTNPTDPDELRCLGEIAPGHYLAQDYPFCLPNMTSSGRGYWGRDHLNNEGIPPDGFRRTMYGLYPAGGRFDNDSGSPVNSPTLGASGEGVQPIMLSAFVDFMLAEAAQTLGTTGDPKALMLSGVRKHFNYVRSFSLSTSEAGVVTSWYPEAEWTAEVNSYVAARGAEWDAAAANRKMKLIGREYWISLFGNGIESYNLYRRTGQPDRMQPALETDPGLFPRSLLYPNDFVVTNRFAEQKADLGVRVFWDTNPAGNGWVY